MSNVLRVRWTIIPQIAPQPWLNCNRCGRLKLFESSGRVRINAQGKRLDAWLVYNCTSCKNSWNRPIFERRNVRDLEPPLLNALLRNDPDYVRRLAFDVEDLRRKCERVAEFPAIDVHKEALNASMSPPDMLELLLVAPFPVGVRLDRLLATELGLSRTRIEELTASGILRISTAGVRALRRPVRDQTIVQIGLSSLGVEIDAEAVAGRVPRIGSAADG
jgi:hypothetical protein